MTGQDKWTPEMLERLRRMVHELDTCDHCSWVITSQAAYEAHLAAEHPGVER